MPLRAAPPERRLRPGRSGRSGERARRGPAARTGAAGPRLRLCPPSSHLRTGGVHDRPYLDGPEASGWIMGRNLGRPLDALRVEHIKSGELLLRLRERAVCYCRKAVSHPHGPTGRGIGERKTFTEELSGLGDFLGIDV